MLQRSARLGAPLRQRSVGRSGRGWGRGRKGRALASADRVRRRPRSIPNRSVRSVAAAAAGVLSTAKLWSNGAAQPRMRTPRL